MPNRIGLGALGEDVGHGGEGEDIVDDGRHAEQADMGGQGRLGPDLAAAALEAFEHARLLATNIGAGADPHLHVEGKGRAEQRRAEQAVPAR